MKTTDTVVTTQPAPGKQSSGKIVYIDHLKVLLITLVVLHHSFITYGAPGSWYYQQKTHLMGALFPMTIFVATNQSFFMGFFFFLSALFIAPSYRKKGPKKFLADRLKRLGIPLVFYSVVLSPVLNYLVEHYGYGEHHSFLGYLSGYHHWIDFGVLWFAAALLLFDLLYVLVKISGLSGRGIKCRLLSTRQFLFAGIALGLVSFLVRLVFPTGWELSPLGFQLGYFPQYIVFFIAGIIASENNWLDQLNQEQGRQMRRLAFPWVLILLPVLFVWYLAFKFPGNYFNGGWNVVSLAYSFWEQLSGVILSVALLSLYKFSWNTQTPFLKQLGDNAFGVYIFHPLVLISISLLLKGWAVNPAVKLLVVGPSAVAGAFLFAGLIRRIPVVRQII